MLTHAVLSFLYFSHGFIQIRLGLFDFFNFCFMSNKYYLSKCNAIKFSLSKDILTTNTILFIDEKNEQRSFDTGRIPLTYVSPEIPL